MRISSSLHSAPIGPPETPMEYGLFAQLLPLGGLWSGPNFGKIILDTASLFPLHSESIRSVRTPAGDAGWQERKAALRRRRSTAAAGNRDGGGAPGGAARPKQAVRASGSSVARATPEARAGGNIRPRGVAHDPGASRRSTRNASGFSCEWLFVNLASAKLGRAGVARTRFYFTSP